MHRKKINKVFSNFTFSYYIYHSGVDPETLLMGGLSYGAIFSMIDGTNCRPKAVLACRSVQL
jgi:hypothetical protein